MSRFLIDSTKATDMAFFCTSAWEGGFTVGLFAGMCLAAACVFAGLLMHRFATRGRA